MESKTIATNDLYEMAVYACAGLNPAQVQPYLDRRGIKLAMAIYNRKGLPRKETFFVTWEDSEGNIQSVPLLSGITQGPNFVSNFINNKREMFKIVDEKGE